MEWLITDDGKYRIESLSAATLPGALKVIKEDFFQDEAVCIGTELNKNPLAGEELLELCADAALDGLSLIAVTTDTKEVVAVLFNKLQVAPSQSSEKTFFEIFAEKRCKQASSRAAVEFMVDLDARCNFFERYGVDCSLELMFLGTRRQHRRKGLAMLLCKTSVELAKNMKEGPIAPLTVQDLGPDYAFMESRIPITKVPKICHGLWSAKGSQKIGKALGFTVIVTVSLKDFFFNGKPYSERVGYETFCEGAALKIV